ncbi:hypothetical protein SCP_0502380 [Sparassis crispa]|uniref:Uncharacterized protein n=1 Tax=Sparassis crispa TaxID=139825 RepID=A0A401GLV5_9APHY|nr:hypothetical protein SCP_0502380 [Sparassis crispa]GBE83191.1 hypothetical protein SCP_0502380 [Sparassis crispa]
METAHPETLPARGVDSPPSLTQILGKLGVPSLPGLGIATLAALKVTAEDAIKETNSGLKRTHKDSTAAANEEAPKKAKKKPTLSSNGKAVTVGSVILIPSGLDEHGDLNDSAGPKVSRVKLDSMAEQGLAYVPEDDKKLQFRDGWNETQVETWLESLLPDAFKYIRENGEPGNRGSVLCARDGQYSTKVVQQKKIVGATLDKYKGGVGRPVKDRKIYIASKMEIPVAIYLNGWEDSTLSGSQDSDSASPDFEPKIKKDGAKPSEKSSLFLSDDEDALVGSPTAGALSIATGIPTVTTKYAAKEKKCAKEKGRAQEMDLVPATSDIIDLTERENSPFFYDPRMFDTPPPESETAIAGPSSITGTPSAAAGPSSTGTSTSVYGFNDSSCNADAEFIRLSKASEPFLKLSQDLTKTKEMPWDWA